MSDTRAAKQTVIVGAGIVGIACAHYLHRAGHTVRVIDRGKIGAGCSHGNCGYISPSHVLPLTEPSAIGLAIKSLFQPNAPFRVKPTLNPSRLRWFWEFARRCTHKQMLAAAGPLKAILVSSMAEYETLIPENGIDCEWRKSGLLFVLKTPHGVDEFRKHERIITEQFDTPAQWLDGDELTQLEPALKPGLAGAYLYKQDGFLRPDKLTRSWAEYLKKQGVQFDEQCELQEVERKNGAISSLKTSQGTIPVDQLVIATGAWSTLLARLLDCKIPIQPGKGYSVLMDRPDPCPNLPMLFPEHKVGVTPFQDRYRLGSMMEFAGYDSSIPRKRIDQLRRSAEPYLISPCTNVEYETWTGWRPMTWDSLPIIGSAPGLCNTFLATGHNMLGVSLAPATGKLLTEIMTSKTPHLDANPYSAKRFQ
ncbi:MAG: FAD-dependent oxidoreductase [Planctomycetaceae bacterium]|nr:FAD-dependent oxidoreductase [Planctomycetaceae bacterium]